MIIVRLNGGMGNQMFQYALGRALSIKNKTNLGLDLTFLLDRTPIPNFTYRNYDLDVFNIKAKIISRKDIPLLYRKYNLGIFMRYVDYIRRKLINTRGKEKKDYFFDKTVLDLGDSSYLEGWWQSPKYFEEIEDMIREDFTFKKKFSDKIENLKNDINNCNSLCLHVRRGDYVGHKLFDIIPKDYNDRAINKIESLTKIDKIYVFSDNIDWCKKNLKFNYPTIFVDDEYSGEKAEGHLYLMSECKNFIIPNSTFAWWGAWLSKNKDKKVIVPNKWIGLKSDRFDLIPEGWIKI